MPTAPRWFLAIALGGAIGMSSWAGARWVDMVERHISESTEGYQRIAALEARVAALEAQAAWCRRRHSE